MNGNMGLRAYRSHRDEALTPNGHVWLLNERESVDTKPTPRQKNHSILKYSVLEFTFRLQKMMRQDTKGRN